jgi:murein DD-endopeptidase MepM/ murein hydrolase activator NlpD
MNLFALTLAIGLMLSNDAFVKPSIPDTLLTRIEIADLDSLLIAIEEIPQDSIQSMDELLYKNIWNSTQIKYPANTLPPKEDTLKIALIGKHESSYVHPVKGPIISKFGFRSGRMHTGTDVKLKSGDTVRCAFDGKVRLAKRFSGYGNLVLVRHTNGLETVYAHLKSISVKLDESIKAGDVIGLGGRTGRATCDHLHFETRLFGEPFDSNKYIDFENYSLRNDFVYYANKQLEIDPKSFKLKPEASKTQLASKAAPGTKHVIRKGDNLWSIARTYKTSVNKICALNNITAQHTLKIGKTLRVN